MGTLYPWYCSRLNISGFGLSRLPLEFSAVRGIVTTCHHRGPYLPGNIAPPSGPILPVGWGRGAQSKMGRGEADLGGAHFHMTPVARREGLDLRQSPRASSSYGIGGVWHSTLAVHAAATTRHTPEAHLYLKRSPRNSQLREASRRCCVTGMEDNIHLLDANLRKQCVCL